MLQAGVCSLAVLIRCVSVQICCVRKLPYHSCGLHFSPFLLSILPFYIFISWGRMKFFLYLQQQYRLQNPPVRLLAEPGNAPNSAFTALSCHYPFLSMPSKASAATFKRPCMPYHANTNKDTIPCYEKSESFWASYALPPSL